MYLVSLKTLLVKALQDTFNDSYPEPDFRGLHVTLEYPTKQIEYPGIWIDYEPSEVEAVGVGHAEFAEVGDNFLEVRRWRFSGAVTYTLVALSSMERDRLHDEMVRVLAFGEMYQATRGFRSYMLDNPYLGLTLNWDRIRTGGLSAIPGTPWDTDDVIYELTLSMDLIGEFVSPTESPELVPLASVQLYPYRMTDETPPGGSEGWG